ncbi:MAG: hypothetical protein ACKVPJ_08190 [Chitinophagales bacterium]
MKKITFIIICFTLQQTLFSQNNSAIGIRFGGSDGVSGEISYQNFIGGPNRIEVDLGFIDADGFDGFKATLMYHWVKGISDSFYWYIGAGGSVGAWTSDEGSPVSDNKHEDGLFIDANGQIGIEYNFEIPLQISLDARPEIGLINDDFDFGYGLGVRYTF